MNLCHGRTSRLHRIQSLLVDIRRFYGVNLLFELGNLRRRLFKVLLVDLLPPKSRFRNSCLPVSARRLPPPEKTTW